MKYNCMLSTDSTISTYMIINASISLSDLKYRLVDNYLLICIYSCQIRINLDSSTPSEDCIVNNLSFALWSHFFCVFIFFS